MKKIALLSFVFLLSCVAEEIETSDPVVVKAHYASSKEQSIAILKKIQSKSIADKVEYCGDIYSVNGELMVDEVIKGTEDGCAGYETPEGYTYVAGYHTHGNYNPDYANEVPSPEDMEAVFAYGVYGFIATPGGRIWEVDPFTKVARQLCGEGCILKDKAYNPADVLPVPQSFTEAQLAAYIKKFDEN